MTPANRLSLALFESDGEGGVVRLIGRTRDPHLVNEVRQLLADECRRDLARLEPLHLVQEGADLDSENLDD